APPRRPRARPHRRDTASTTRRRWRRLWRAVSTAKRALGSTARDLPCPSDSRAQPAWPSGALLSIVAAMIAACNTPPTYVPHRRTSFSPLVSVPSLALFYGLGVPTVKLLELFGKWPGVLARPPGGRKRHGDFGDYRPNAHDIVACSWFKSGTNLLMHMTLQI